MNKSYRSIFNESLSAWVAVSEIEVAHGKSSAGSRIRLRRMPGMRFVMGALIAAMIYGWGGSAQAACIYSVTGGSTNLRIEVIPDTPAELSLCLSSINKTMHYVSINSASGMGNYYNDGATGVNAIAIGANASASGSAAAALGYGAQATVAGGVALGRNSVADRPAILPAAAYVPAGATAGQTTAIQNTVVGSLGAVSVGSAAGTRQITNVAAGSADTDAVNVAQLKAINATASAGWNLTTSQSAGTVIGTTVEQVQPGETVTLDAGKNIVLTQAGNKTTIAVNDNPSFTSVTASTGFYVGTTGPSMTTAGIDAGGLVIGSVAAGAVNATSTDAINGSQLYAVQQTASAGWNLQANGGPVTNIAPNGTVNVVNGSNTTAVLTGNQLQVNVVSNPTFTGTVTAPTFVASGGNPITISGATGTIGGLTNTTFDPLSYTSGQAATEDQLAEVARTANNPLTFAGDSGTPVARKLGETVNIVGGAAGTLTDGNIGVVADGTDTLTVKLAKDINLGATGSVTIGNTLVNTSGLTITGGPSVTTSGIDAGEKAITNVADGVNATDAVNVRQLNGAIGSIASRIDTVDRNASAGTASAMAMAGMPQAFTPGKSMFGFGAGTYRGQSAFAMGVSTMTDNGKWVIKGSLSGDSRGNVGGSVGAGFQW